MTALLVLFALLGQVADILTTIAVLDKGGREVNPITRWVMDKAGDSWWAWKFGAMLLVALIAVEIGATWVLWLMVFVGFGAAAWNYREAKR